MPSLRIFPPLPGLGIIRSRTGIGRNSPAFTVRPRSSRKPWTPTSSMSMALRPSTPADLAPVLPATRAHATFSVPGSYTRLNRSSKRRPGSATAQSCSLACILDTPANGPTTAAPPGAPVFTGASVDIAVSLLLVTAAALRHVTGSPGLGLLRRLRPVPTRSVDGGPNPSAPAGRAGTGVRTGTVPVFTVIRSTKEEPDFVPAASPRLPRSTSPWPPTEPPMDRPGVPRHHPPTRETGDRRRRVRTAPSPYPPGSGPVRF